MKELSEVMGEAIKRTPGVFPREEGVARGIAGTRDKEQTMRMRFKIDRYTKEVQKAVQEMKRYVGKKLFKREARGVFSQGVSRKF